MVQPEVPPFAKTPCPAPAGGPDRDLTAQEVTTLWGRDRAALRVCEARRKAAVEALVVTAPTP